MNNLPDERLIHAEAGDFNDIRDDVAERLFNDPSYTAYDAMHEMSDAAEEHINGIAKKFPTNKLWVGGSLGRREMLPNSDIDLFVVYDSEYDEDIDIKVEGVDKFEIGHITTDRLSSLLRYSLVDANRFIDGRRIGSVPAPEVEQMILEANTQDHQLANNISEYFFYRYFDFPNKTTSMGPNLKYSTGSSRDTIFFNMISRMSTGDFPAVRGATPELLGVMEDAEQRYGISVPYNAVNLIFTVKNAAISVFDKTGDPRSRYVSPHSLESIYEFSKDKYSTWGIHSSRQFIEAYSAARQELELAVDTLFTKSLADHPASKEFSSILSIPGKELPVEIPDIIIKGSDFSHATNTLATWLATANNPSASDMKKIADALIDLPLDKSWGALMAVACSPHTPDATLQQLSTWLYKHERGAYLLKLITRNTSASATTKSEAIMRYRDKEIIL